MELEKTKGDEASRKGDEEGRKGDEGSPKGDEAKPERKPTEEVEGDEGGRG
jgi:hypothetical protein